MERISAHMSTNGFEDILYPVNNRKDKLIIVVSGSNGGLSMTKQCAEFYAENGIPSLALALFKTKDLTCVIARVPSYFVSEGLIAKRPSGNSCWSYQGQEIPFARYKLRNFNIPKIII